MKKIIFGLIMLIGIVLFATQQSQSFATSVPYKVICHHTPSNAVTLTFQNVQSYNGHLGTPHSGSTYDTNGACAIPTTVPTVIPTVVPTTQPCQDEEKWKDDDWQPCVSPSVVPSTEPSVTPTLEPTATPSATTTVSSGGDGRSDGLSSCPDCTKAHNNAAVPAGPPATGKGN